MTSKIDPFELVKTQSRDSMKWAESFSGVCEEFTKDEILDEGYMVGWFANSMMAMYDSLHNNEIKLLTDKISKLKGLMLLVDPSVSDECVATVQVTQWDEYTKCFPDELE